MYLLVERCIVNKVFCRRDLQVSGNVALPSKVAALIQLRLAQSSLVVYVMTLGGVEEFAEAA